MSVKVLYDSAAFDMQTHGGVSKCFCELYKNLPPVIDRQMGVLGTKNVHLQELGFPSISEAIATAVPFHKLIGKKNAFEIYKLMVHYKNHNLHCRRHLPFNKSYCMELLRKGDFDVFHPSYYDTYILDYIGRRPFVLTVHDMIPEIFMEKYFPKDDKQILDKKVLIPRADHIVAVSEKTKEDLMSIFHIPSNRITVIYHGCDDFCYLPSEESCFSFPYLLYVGQRWSYKMFKEFAEGCVPFLHEHPEIKVVCTSAPFNQYDLSLLKALGMTDRFVHHFVASDRDIYDLYHHALAFVYPSLYEGFGIPILEAYKAGCPVMLNHASCFPEIAGDAAIYFNLDEEGSNLSERLTYLYNLKPEDKQDLLNRQNERLKLYSWKKSAQQLAEVYLRYGH